MPLANICVLEGHARPVLKKLLREFSEVYSDILGAPEERLQVWIQEVDPELYAVAGEPADQVLATRDHGEVEILLIRLVMMEGRPDSQIADAIASPSEVVFRNLGGSSSRLSAAWCSSRMAPRNRSWSARGNPCCHPWWPRGKP